MKMIDENEEMVEEEMEMEEEEEEEEEERDSGPSIQILPPALR